MGGHASKSNTPGTSDLQSFDATFQTRMTQVINTIADGAKVGSLSFNSHSQVTECLLDMNQDAIKLILDCKKDIWNDKEFLELVKEYFDYSMKTLDFCNALKKCLQRAKDSLLPLRAALEHFDEDTEKDGNSRYARALQGLKKFKAAGDPFTAELIQIYESVKKQQEQMLKSLQVRMDKLNKKLKHIRTLRVVSSVILVVTAAVVCICTVLAAALPGPHGAAALAVVAKANPTRSMGKHIELLKEFENALEGQLEVTICANKGTLAAKTELENIWNLIDGLKHETESLMKNANSAIKQEAVNFAIAEIRSKLGDFTKGVEELRGKAEKCRSSVMEKREEVLQRIKMLSHN